MFFLISSYNSCNIRRMQHYIDSLMHDCSISSALALELLQSCTKPSIYYYMHGMVETEGGVLLTQAWSGSSRAGVVTSRTFTT